jgi:hypothetical protein
MNERIKELAEQAGLDMTFPHCISGGIDDLERFAELVLKEATLQEISDIGQEIEQAEKQEPVAWMYKDGTTTADPDRADGTWTPLYEAPPKWEFVGLTDEEIVKGAKESWVDKQAFESVAWWADAKLKEKNHG